MTPDVTTVICISLRFACLPFAAMADVAKGGDGAKSAWRLCVRFSSAFCAFCGYYCFSMVIEMRTHRTKPGLRAQFVEVLRSRSFPAQKEIGIKLLGPFLSLEDPDVVFFLRGFPDLASRDRMKEEFYEGPVFKGELKEIIVPMLEKWDAVLVDDSEGLIHWP